MLQLIKNYIADLIVAHKKLILASWSKLLSRVPPSLSCRLKNFEQDLRNNKTTFHYDADRKLYFAMEDESIHYFGIRERGYEQYTNGLGRRSARLAASYFIDSIDFSESDTVIDCGANFGDLGLFFKLHIKHTINYITFEPSAIEHRCIQLNHPDGLHHPMALSNQDGSFEFYVSSEGGDSSLIEPSSGFTEITQVQCTTLNKFATQNDIKNAKLLKLEAEGLEPEILDGAMNVIDKIEYIAVDGGAERGLNNESTLEYLTNKLLTNGFEMVRCETTKNSGRALFRNLKLQSYS